MMKAEHSRWRHVDAYFNARTVLTTPRGPDAQAEHDKWLVDMFKADSLDTWREWPVGPGPLRPEKVRDVMELAKNYPIRKVRSVVGNPGPFAIDDAWVFPQRQLNVYPLTQLSLAKSFGKIRISLEMPEAMARSTIEDALKRNFKPYCGYSDFSSLSATAVKSYLRPRGVVAEAVEQFLGFPLTAQPQAVRYEDVLDCGEYKPEIVLLKSPYKPWKKK